MYMTRPIAVVRLLISTNFINKHCNILYYRIRIWCILTDFLKPVFSNQRLRNLTGPGWSEDISIKPTKHDSNADEIMDTGSDKRIDPELDLKTAENFEENDTKSVEVTDGVEDSSKEVNEKEGASPNPALVYVRPSFKSTVEKE